MISKNDFTNDVVSHVAEILLLDPVLVKLVLVLGETTSSFATVYEGGKGKSRINIDPTQIEFYEKLLRNNGVDVEVAFLNPFP